MSALVDRLAAALYEADNFIESWSDARHADRTEYLAIAAADIAAHDHALAEKIRSNADMYKGALFGGERLGARLAADLIDPEVKP